MIDSVPGLIFILFRQLSDPVLGEGYGNNLMRGERSMGSMLRYEMQIHHMRWQFSGADLA